MIIEQLLKDTLIFCLCGLFVAGYTERCIRNLFEDTILPTCENLIHVTIAPFVAALMLRDVYGRSPAIFLEHAGGTSALPVACGIACEPYSRIICSCWNNRAG